MIEEILLGIGDQLRFVLFGVGCVLNVEFDHAETERLFDECEAEDRVSAKNYTLFASRHVTVTGRVDEYEPESVWLRVESRKPYAPSLAVIADWAQYQAYHVRRRGEAEA